PSAAALAFGAGAATLAAGLLACRAALRSFRVRSALDLTLGRVGARSAGRRPGRSLATVGLLASGVFLVVTVGIHRLDVSETAGRVDSGTGGYALYAESTVRLRHDLDAPESADTFGLDEEVVARIRSLPMRTSDGDEASCLNLGSAQNPVLAGVPAAALAARGAFSFTEVEGDAPSPWSLLERPRADGAVPVIGDAGSVHWGLHKAVGDTLESVDGRGRRFEARIVATTHASVLQGMLLVDDAVFRERFPDAGGFRRFLIDVDGAPDEVRAELTRAYADVGLEVTTTGARLAAYLAVQNTYLTIFQTLGALGVLLGTLGLALVVLRNLFERRGELAALRAVGFSRGMLRRLLLWEHGLLLGLGVLTGSIAALVSVLPLRTSGGSLAPWTIVIGVVGVGVLSVVGASGLATRGRLVDALRVE
ncbi:MAG: FtsX-like permease family protein, partial [Planctomycetota bacterium JB042]